MMHLLIGGDIPRSKRKEGRNQTEPNLGDKLLQLKLDIGERWHIITWSIK
jgi:hypothetical protein